MNIAIRYYTKSGNTKKLAEAAAEVAGVPALPVSTPLTEPADLLFLGSSVYAGTVDREVKQFIASLDSTQVKKVVNFSTSALPTSTYQTVEKLLAARNIPLDRREFHCRGRFHFLHRTHPDEEDLARMKAFARSVLVSG
ncbi:MAG: flavodoxin family protein [Oscillospiraceae bacterium]|jgi:flavodoxin|nr:flavodoxin family protein [Oscillospiraceae bacterium]